jgi:hypothetical protein
VAVPPKPVFGTNANVPGSKLSALADLAQFAAKPPACAVSRSTAQSISTATVTYITFDTEVIDTTGTMFSASSTTITIPETGIYMVSGYCGLAVNATGYRRLLLDQNGTFMIIDARPAVSGDNTHMTLNTLLACALGDTLRLAVDHSAGVSLNTVTTQAPRFTVAWQSSM